jgi:hypothetical protein
MSTANNTIPPLGSTDSPATRGGPETTVAAGRASLSETETSLHQPLRIILAEWWAAGHGWTAPLLRIGYGAPR